MLVESILKGVVDTVTPTKGNGWVESAVFIILIVSMVIFNGLGIELSETFDKIMWAMMAYMVGVNTSLPQKRKGGAE